MSIPLPSRPTEVARGIYAVDHAVAEGKNAIIFSDKGAWAVDTGTFPAEGRAMREFIQARGYAADKLIYTHGHPDHVLGSADFRAALVVAHALTPVEIHRLLPTWAARAETTPAALAQTIAWPTLTFPHELSLDLGNFHVHIFPTPGHSQDGVSLYVQEYKLLIAGDAVVTGIVPAIGDGDSRILCATLRKLRTLDIEILVPGHGPVVYGIDRVQDWLRWIGAYLDDVRHMVDNGRQRGLSAATVAEQIPFERLVGDRLPADKHNMPRRHRATVEKIIQEEWKKQE